MSVSPKLSRTGCFPSLNAPLSTAKGVDQFRPSGDVDMAIRASGSPAASPLCDHARYTVPLGSTPNVG